jgi:pimeloyl-ACP methyl ester carboxylesterase
MTRLGYERFAAQGGDWGSLVTLEVGRRAPDRVVGVHVNSVLGYATGNEDPQDDDERVRLGQLKDYQQRLSGYMQIQARRPMALSYGLTDSPVGQLAWIMDMFGEWTGTTLAPEKSVSRDRMLTDVMLYWLTRTAGSSAQLYLEAGRTWGQQPTPLTVPVGVALFAGDMSMPVRRLAEPWLGNVQRWNEFEDGGHFAALEQPEVLVGEIRQFFGSLT